MSHSYPNTYTSIELQNFGPISYEYHGGQTSALYSFASTGGIIHNRGHASDLETEIADSIKTARKYSPNDVPKLEEFLQVVIESADKLPMRLRDFIDSQAKDGYNVAMIQDGKILHVEASDCEDYSLMDEIVEIVPGKSGGYLCDRTIKLKLWNASSVIDTPQLLL